jgi:ADP-heptose:LPS heptosyltransferase
MTLKKWLGIPHPCEAPNSIFIGLIGGVGDLISAAPSVVALKKKYPDTQITFGVGDGIFFNTIKNDPNIDHFETPFFYNVWKKRARRNT